MAGQNAKQANQLSSEGAAPTAERMDEYDPFARGPFPVGVRTISARDTTRERLYSCEIWYPASAQHVGQDMAPATQDVFTAPSGETRRRQMAVRDAVAQSGTYPLILFSHSKCRGIARNCPNNAVSWRVCSDSAGNAADRGALFGGTGPLVHPRTDALPHGGIVEGTRRSAAILDW